MTSGTYAIIADGVLTLHVALVTFVIAGQVLVMHGWRVGWSWTRNLVFRLTHLAVVVFVVLETWFSFTCPLTALEGWLRRRAGHAVRDDVGCIAYWVQKLFFYSAPEWIFGVVYSLFALAVVLSFVFYPPRGNIDWNRRSNRAE
jgi:hypothetical protein